MKNKRRNKERLAKVFKGVKYEDRKEAVPDWLKKNLDEKLKSAKKSA